MAATVAPTHRDTESFVLEGVSWRSYESLLRDLADRRVYLTYDEGRLELMSPLLEHERLKKLIGQMVEIVCLERSIPRLSAGSTTVRREDLRKGLEPDECYYLQHEKQVRGRKRLHLPEDPPPDLVVEIDVTHRALDRERIYEALGVPEIWRFDGRRIEFLVLLAGSYRARSASRAFPFIQASDLQRFLERLVKEGETTGLRAFRDWVREGIPSRPRRAARRRG
jgi:Uma2 family endonuclease